MENFAKPSVFSIRQQYNLILSARKKIFYRNAENKSTHAFVIDLDLRSRVFCLGLEAKVFVQIFENLKDFKISAYLILNLLPNITLFSVLLLAYFFYL